MERAYKQEKIDKLNKLKEHFEDAKSIVLVDYKGINIEQVDELRNRLRDMGIEYFVEKNTLIKLALNRMGETQLDDCLVGPTAVAVSKTDEVAPARELTKFKKEVMEGKDFPSLKAGLIDGSFFTVDHLEQLAKLPSKDELVAKVLATFNAPISSFVGVMQAMIRQFVYVVDAIAKKELEN